MTGVTTPDGAAGNYPTTPGGWAAPGGPVPGTGPGWAAPDAAAPQPVTGGAPQPSYPPGPGPSGYPTPPGWGPYAPVAQPLQPGVIPLRPLSVGEVLDGSITLIRRNPRATLGVSAIVAVVLLVIRIVLQQVAIDPNVGSGASTVVTIIESLVNFVATLVVAGFITAVAGEAVLGRPISLEQVWTRVRPKLPAIVGAAVVVGVLTAISVIGLIVGVLIPFTVYAFVTPVIVLENGRAMPSLKRSRALVKGAFWRTLGILVLATIITAVLSSIFLIPFAVVAALGSGSFSTTVNASSTTLALVLLDIGAAVASMLTLPFSAGVHTLLYVDQRMRSEGLDVSLRQAAMAPPEGP